MRGDVADAVPVMLHNFMLAAREAGVTMRQFRGDPRIIARCFIEATEKYGTDGILLDIDTATLAGAAGAPIEFPEDQPALCRGARLQTLEEVDDLPPADIRSYPTVQVWLEAARELRRYFGIEKAIRGNAISARFHSRACCDPHRLGCSI